MAEGRAVGGVCFHLAMHQQGGDVEGRKEGRGHEREYMERTGERERKMQQTRTKGSKSK